MARVSTPSNEQMIGISGTNGENGEVRQEEQFPVALTHENGTSTRVACVLDTKDVTTMCQTHQVLAR